MLGRSSQPKALVLLGVLVALVAVAGTVALGWEWGETDDLLPMVIGVAAAVTAVGWTLYSRLV